MTTTTHTYLTATNSYLTFLFQIFILCLYASYLHRIFGFIAGSILREILGTNKTPGNGKFNIHFDYIAFRLGLDCNQIVIANVKWLNTDVFKHTPYFLNIKEIVVSFDIMSVLNIFVFGDKTTPIIIHEIVINSVKVS